MFRQNNFLPFKFSKIFSLLLTFLMCVSSIASTSAAQDDGRPLDELEEVVVTAAFREQA